LRKDNTYFSALSPTYSFKYIAIISAFYYYAHPKKIILNHLPITNASVALEHEIILMDHITLIGLMAAICTTTAFVPQVIAILRTGNVEGISVLMYSIFTVGIALWLSYGILVQDLPMLLANSISLVLALMVLGLTVYKRWQHKKQILAETPITV